MYRLANRKPDYSIPVPECIASFRYEGAFGGEPCNEAHGGYVFCAVATLFILGATDRVRDIDLERWLCRRQRSVEGGFQGRTNKLVDGCYSFWQCGALFLVACPRHGKLSPHTSKSRLIVDRDSTVVCSHPFTGRLPEQLSQQQTCNSIALQGYILSCSQLQYDGGFRDKPGKLHDMYHTCYCLSGLSTLHDGEDGEVAGRFGQLRSVNPLFGIVFNKVCNVQHYFNLLPSAHQDLQV
mmetsp:Transcript_9099/g.37416  ORF Transcript_9099/g.37416 Transcript_9099/m.37416 type:complete len:238 (+) Transcript_9099:42-755(+)